MPGRGEFRAAALGIAALVDVHPARAIGVIGIIGWICGCASQSYVPTTYVVRREDTLYAIAWRHDLDYRDLARWNNIGPDYRIAVGQILTLRPPPRAGGVSAPPAAKSAQARAAPQPRGPPRTPPHPPAAASGPGSGGAASANREPTAIEPEGEGRHWVWPTAHTVPPRPVPGGGILLLGQLGQPVRAAASGHVVYVGNGLRGYGNLIIIKHGENLLSAYAHTRELTIREGEDVVAGEAIAAMGEGPHRVAALYFEIRLNGKPVDPLPYLTAGKQADKPM